MSDIAAAWVRQNVFGIGDAKILLLMLANYADADNTCFPGIERLAIESEKNVRTIRRWLKTLRDAGLVESTERYRRCSNPRCGQGREHVHRTSNYYRLILDTPVGVPPTPESLGITKKECDPVVDTVSGAPIEDKMSPMGEGAENSHSSHRGQNVPYGMEDKMSSMGVGFVENGGFPHMGQNVPHDIGDTGVQAYGTRVSPILIRNEQPDKESPDLTRPDLFTDQEASAASRGRVRAGVSSHSREDVSLSADELAALSECVPAALQAMDAVSAKTVAGLLVERLLAGWKPWQIRQILDRPLPPDVAHLGGLVAYRVRTNVDVHAAPAVLEARLKAARVEREAQLLAQDEEGPIPEPEFVAFMEDVQDRFPALSEAEKTRMWLAHRSGERGLARV